MTPDQEQEIRLLEIDIANYTKQGLKFSADFSRERIKFLKGNTELQQMKYVKGTTEVKGHYIKDFTGTQIKLF